jgi:hypothetical protein
MHNRPPYLFQPEYPHEPPVKRKFEARNPKFESFLTSLSVSFHHCDKEVTEKSTLGNQPEKDRPPEEALDLPARSRFGEGRANP